MRASCFEAKYLENTKYEILLKTVKEKSVFYHTGLDTDAIIRTEVCPLQQQIRAYRAYLKAFEDELPFLDEGYLIAEYFDYRLFLDTHESLDLHLRSLNFKNADSRLTHYFFKNRAKEYI